LVLRDAKGTTDIPYMTWSAGQREFIPLLTGLYWLLPASKMARRESLEWVVLEELEAGLHPGAISAVLLMVMELLRRDYTVCLSTHSPQVLDVVWAIRNPKAYGASPEKLLELFRAPRTPQMKEFAARILAKDLRVYYFDAGTGTSKDISTLDPASADDIESGWGGLAEYSGRIADVVASKLGKVVAPPLWEEPESCVDLYRHPAHEPTNFSRAFPPAAFVLSLIVSAVYHRGAWRKRTRRGGTTPPAERQDC
jgi:hypothetical protein